ncbi:MAG: 30S ribosomal protein S18 [Anaerolineae bacterium]
MGYRRRNKGNFRRKKVCSFCVDKIQIDYKEADTLRRFTNEFGRIKPRRQTGTCTKHQRRLAVAVKRARHIALLPFVND